MQEIWRYIWLDNCKISRFVEPCFLYYHIFKVKSDIVCTSPFIMFCIRLDPIRCTVDVGRGLLRRLLWYI